MATAEGGRCVQALETDAPHGLEVGRPTSSEEGRPTSSAPWLVAPHSHGPREPRPLSLAEATPLPRGSRSRPRGQALGPKEGQRRRRWIHLIGDAFIKFNKKLDVVTKKKRYRSYNPPKKNLKFNTLFLQF